MVPNGSHSNISVIRCPERFELTNRINWISFPRLDRNPINIEAIDSKVALTNRIILGPDYTFTGHMKYLAYDPGSPQTGVMTSIDKDLPGSSWNQSPGDLYEVYSTRGYQLQVTPDQQFIYFFGHIQDPDIPVELEGTPADRFSNWVGYYLTYPQSPFDAIPENVLENLTMISGQYWSCSRYNPSPIESGYDCWRCGINQGRVEINYGDMVKLTSTASTSFTWLQNNPEAPSVEKLKAESFIYNEQYDYEAIFIELDTNDSPEEIGAFAGDSCVGATKVLPGDTTVLICAYTEGFEGQDITFEFSYATKAARINQPDYFVLNQGTGISERRRIQAGENQPCHFVSFKQKKDNQSNTFSNRLNCYPNPASDAFSLSYFIPEDGYAELEILNPLGLVILEKTFGYLTQGNHTFDVQIAGLPVGYYFVRLYAGKQIHAGTLLINR